jgi:hypothetical protein
MNKSRDLFFFHIPKTAGASMQWVLSQKYGHGQIAARTWTELLLQDRNKLSNAKLIQGHFYGSVESVFGRSFSTFTMLRDPIERALSHYGHVIRDKNHYLHARAMALGSLSAYIEDSVTQMTISNFQARMLAFDEDVEKIFATLGEDDIRSWQLERTIETTHYSNDSDILLETARSRLKNFFLVGITEKFTQSLALICRELGWNYPNKLEIRNTNPDRLLASEADLSIINRLQDLNKLDILIYREQVKALEGKVDEALISLANKRALWGPVGRLMF